jgi:multicomponent Na+:H+ antiporter subunit F
MTTVASSVLLPAMLLLLLTLAVGLVRALRGPSMQDRMLSILLIGSGGVALLLLMSGYLNMPALIDVSLVLALLAVLAAAALTRIEVDHD